MTDQDRLNSRLFYAAIEGNSEALSQALDEGANGKEADSAALKSAATNGRTKCVRLLIPVSDPMADDSVALASAALYGHLECVRLLIPVSDCLANGSYALRRAARNGHLECVALLLPVSDALAVGEEGLDAASVARRSGHAETAGMIEAFIESQALTSDLAGAPRGPVAKKSL